MVRAVEEFFPESKILDDNGAELNADMEKEREKEREQEKEERAKDGPQLRRASTALSSIVGPHNGDLPGGFVLVVDGVALEDVCALFTLFSHSERRCTSGLDRH
jgi:phospholipid-translocating ATPase